MIHAVNDAVFELVTAKLFGQRLQERLVLFVQGLVEDLNMVSKISSMHRIIIGIIASAHGIEQHVSKVASILRFVACGLQAIVMSNYSTDIGSGGLKSFLNDLFVVRLGYLMQHGTHIACVFLHIHDEHPLAALAGLQRQGIVQQVSPLYAFGLRLGVDSAAMTESVKLHG